MLSAGNADSSLASLAGDWALRFSGDHQIAIVYHDDNANGIPQAHVVANNTNLKTGNRMQTRNPLELNRALHILLGIRPPAIAEMLGLITPEFMPVTFSTVISSSPI